MLPFKSLDDYKVTGKRVLVRIDINSPLFQNDLKIKDESKIAASVPTIQELSEKGAKVVLIAHQGKKGQWDFVPLSQHAEILQRMLSKEVRYIDDLLGPTARNAIQSLDMGDIILLKNLRNLDGEPVRLPAKEHSKGLLVSSLSPMFDLFVNDAFGSIHRAHASIVGFPLVLPSVAGRLIEKELTTLSRFIENPERPSVFVLGGVKFADSIPIIENLLEKGTADNILLGGWVGLSFAAATGKNIGKENMESIKDELTPERLNKMRDLFARFKDEIALPIDIALNDDGSRIEWELDSDPPNLSAMDIGQNSISKFGEILSHAKTILISGPVGVFEMEQFSTGTKAIFERSVSSGAFCVIGGGHTVAAAKQLGFIGEICYASTGGGALENLLLGKSLPALDALVESAKRFP